jgi:hypothetical protein
MGFDCLVCQETAADAVRCSHCSKLFWCVSTDWQSCFQRAAGS